METSKTVWHMTLRAQALVSGGDTLLVSPTEPRWMGGGGRRERAVPLQRSRLLHTLSVIQRRLSPMQRSSLSAYKLESAWSDLDLLPCVSARKSQLTAFRSRKDDPNPGCWCQAKAPSGVVLVPFVRRRVRCRTMLDSTSYRSLYSYFLAL